MTIIEELNQWFLGQCNDEWEHSFGVSIETLDNPGWLVKIDLTQTLLEDRPFHEMAEKVDPQGHLEGSDWFHCQVVDNQFVGTGDPSSLERILEVFLDWSKTEE